MTAGAKIGIAIGVLALGFGAYIAYSKWSLPKMVSKSGKKITVRYKGKDIVIDVQDLSDKGMDMNLGSNWSLEPLYGNYSDKKNSLVGLSLKDSKGSIRNSFLF